MPFSQKGKIRSGYLVGLLLLLVSYGLILYNTYQLHDQARDISHSYSILNKLGGLSRQVAEAEGSVRGYMITRIDSFLTTYSQIKRNLPGSLHDLSKSVGTDPYLEKRLDTLKGLVAKRLEILDWSVDQFQRSGETITSNMMSRRTEAQGIMDSIRRLLQEMSTGEDGSMNERTDRFTNFFQQTRNITLWSIVIGFFAILYSYFFYNKENNAKREAYEKSIRYENELKENIRQLEVINAEIRDLRGLEKFAATGRVARTIAHEVRNPLTNISLAAEQLQEHGMDGNESTVLLEMIHRNTVRINQLVSDLLNATRFIQLVIQRVSINKLLDDTIAFAQDRIELHHIKLVKEYSAENLMVAVDEEKIKIAFLNIILNAIEAMEPGKGILKVLTRKEYHKCIVEISDNGSGMDEETVQSLFEPFFTSKQKGGGLGLTNAQNIILSHKGKILVHSTKGEGTRFTILLEQA